MKARTDWPGLLRLATLRLAIPPAAFWRLSLKEWRDLTVAPPGAAPLGRADLDALLSQHPDTAP